jgi:hypothetical protein
MDIVINEPAQTQIDEQQPIAQQVPLIVDGLGLSPAAWQSGGILVNLPAYSPAGSAVLAELHGRMGHFPTVFRLRANADGATTQYEVAELIDLQQLRDAARGRR